MKGTSNYFSGRSASNNAKVILPHQGSPGLAVLLLALWAVASVYGQASTKGPNQTNAVQAEMDAAIKEVKRIVNQPVTWYPRKASMQVGEYPGWFHPGATKPNFNTVDVRQTQDTLYDKYEYVASDLNPRVAFRGRELEFNSMTKYFYLDRSVPKKKLSQEEMLEINRLYRIIGRCEQQLADLKNPSANAGSRSRLLDPTTGGTLVVVALFVLFFIRKWRSW